MKTAGAGVAVLPDVLRRKLRIVFHGSAARAGAYYAGQGNMFRPTLFKLGFTPRRLEPSELDTLPDYGVGLTELA